ncbi:extracellular catalytic domain type 1 short-chain-length polyhydroxyalkanoate depolymerase [Roseicyclus marinus]|uniref:extracellular catalytic domain type 1 short-chain-length polyhydroxyalkanoate depolymerase n=1 Tax=Roseicyclus marinus TaxID=2161673 RepID=UPI003D6789F8
MKKHPTLPLQARRPHLSPLETFGTDPGGLRASTFVPKSFTENGPLVVVLHGSSQSARSYDIGSGWSVLAEELGVTLLFPRQRLANNSIGSFNWFMTSDSRRGKGEALSIRQMIRRVVKDHKVDPKRVFVTGLSSGGAMTSVMLATYPEVFAGGAIVAGLPYRSADNLTAALFRMNGYGIPSDRRLSALVRGASKFTGPWPTISVWHGDSDTTVDQANAGAIVGQWQKLHKVEGPPTRIEKIDGAVRRVWCEPKGRAVIEEYIVAAMGHGMPINPRSAHGLGKEGKYMLDVGISSTRHIAAFWGLTPKVAPARVNAGA